MAVFPAGAQIYRAPLVFCCHAGDLVGQLSAGLHVFQSVVVARPFRFRVRSYFCGTGMPRESSGLCPSG